MNGTADPPAPSDAGLGGGYPLSLLLAALAGAVDAIGFVHWRGLFVSFMSGNSTILGSATARADWHAAAVSGSVIGSFVAGVVLGELVGAAVGFYARAIVLMLEAILLAAGAGAAFLTLPELTVAPLLSLAMGVQNASVHRAGGINVALTYVTGTLVHVGRGAAKALRGAGPWSAVWPYLGLWGALVSGAAVGALAALHSDWMALAGAALAALLFAIAAAVMAWDRAALPPEMSAS